MRLASELPSEVKQAALCVAPTGFLILLKGGILNLKHDIQLDIMAIFSRFGRYTWKLMDIETTY